MKKQIKKGQYWKSKDSGKILKIMRKNSENTRSIEKLDEEDIKRIMEIERRLFSNDTWTEFRTRVSKVIVARFGRPSPVIVYPEKALIKIHGNEICPECKRYGYNEAINEFHKLNDNAA